MASTTFGGRQEATVSITLQVGDGMPVNFTKTGYGKTLKEAEDDAKAKLKADKMYQRMSEREGVKIVS